MAHPKRRHSKSRSKKRRTHWKLSEPQFSNCPRCGQAKMPHRVCPGCGYYKDKKVLEIKKKEKKKKS
ncbi:MAG: 50S ribosomal protein L32 [Candidatus Omnitrophota bacterium]|nr:50S ribosomal protein L32 [Candidatus Omnitrophota bacterium]